MQLKEEYYLKNRGKRLFLIQLIGGAVLSILLCLFLHECGHLLVGIAMGGGFEGVSQFKAVLSFGGVQLSGVQRSLLFVAGVMFPIILYLCAVCVMKIMGVKRRFLKLLLFVCGVMFVAPLLVWVAVPVAMQFFGGEFSGEDVVKFVYSSGWSWWGVSLLAMVVIVVVGCVVKVSGVWSDFVQMRREVTNRGVDV